MLNPCLDCGRTKQLRRRLCVNCYQKRQNRGLELPPLLRDPGPPEPLLVGPKVDRKVSLCECGNEKPRGSGSCRACWEIDWSYRRQRRVTP